MNYPHKLDALSKKLSQSKHKLEKYELMIEISHEYKKMWKLRKALEISQQALIIGHEIIQDSFKSKTRLKKEEKTDFFSSSPIYA